MGDMETWRVGDMEGDMERGRKEIELPGRQSVGRADW